MKQILAPLALIAAAAGPLVAQGLGETSVITGPQYVNYKIGPGSGEKTVTKLSVPIAFIFPLIALIAFGFIDIGRAVFSYNTLTNAAREAARVAAVNQLDPAAAPWECLADHPVEDPADPHWTFRGCAMTAGRTGSSRACSISAVTGRMPP